MVWVDGGENRFHKALHSPLHSPPHYPLANIDFLLSAKICTFVMMNAATMKFKPAIDAATWSIVAFVSV
jgi:hypothetical protein